MIDYRIYFMDDRAAIQARDEFTCDDDAAALVIANRLAEACSEFYVSYELWRGAHRLVPPAAAGNKVAHRAWRDQEEINLAIQETVIDRERVLLESKWAVSNSQKLLQATNKLASDLAKRGDGKAGR